MNLAINNISPIRPDLQVVEPRVADLDDGYTRSGYVFDELNDFAAQLRKGVQS
ncbi:TPA: hypothetical protein PRO49_001815 [Escherichia coli]|nr:hypothetical protein [Escherichia coli]